MISNKFSALLGGRLLKITKVSDDTGISRTTLTGLYYRRSKAISFDVLDRLCGYLGCSVGDIIEFDGGSAPQSEGGGAGEGVMS